MWKVKTKEEIQNVIADYFYNYCIGDPFYDIGIYAFLYGNLTDEDAKAHPYHEIIDMVQEERKRADEKYEEKKKCFTT